MGRLFVCISYLPNFEATYPHSHHWLSPIYLHKRFLPVEYHKWKGGEPVYPKDRKAVTSDIQVYFTRQTPLSGKIGLYVETALFLVQNRQLMKIYKRAPNAILVEHEGYWYASSQTDWDQYVNRDNLYEALKQEISSLEPVAKLGEWMSMPPLLAPIGSQEVWAAGVTYLRSKVARMEESEQSGGATFYDKVYEAERPELFFKATAPRVIAPFGTIRVRKDSSWDVPEPELTLFVNSSAKIVAYTIGNDVSSRSIEGENPLYLPQAKVYNGSAALGPCLYVPEEPIPADSEISMTIKREAQEVFQGSIRINQMKRAHTELVEFLYREYDFPVGCFLMTGTCIVPGNDFTLQSGDEVAITIDHIGTLVNTVA